MRGPSGQAGLVLGIIVFDAQHHVQAHRVHEAKGAGLHPGGLTVDGIHHLRRSDALGDYSKRLAFSPQA